MALRRPPPAPRPTPSTRPVAGRRPPAAAPAGPPPLTAKSAQEVLGWLRAHQEWAKANPKYMAGHPQLAAALSGKMPGFAPYQAPTTPPVGSYDPALDAQLGAAKRGFGDLQADIGYDPQGNPTGTQAVRSQDDYLLARDNAQRQHQQGLSNLMRNYMILGQRQEVALRRQGQDEGGAAVQSKQVRGANQQRETTQLNESSDRSLGALALNYQRHVADYGTQLSRAARELTAFGLDIGKSEWAQYAQSGFPAVGPPAGEGTAAGQPYREVTLLGQKAYVTPDGQLHQEPPGGAKFGVTPFAPKAAGPPRTAVPLRRPPRAPRPTPSTSGRAARVY